MTVPTLTEIMEGLDARLGTIPGLRHKAYLADQVVPGTAVVQVPDIDSYHPTFGDDELDVTLSVWLFVSATLDRVGQRKLAEFISDTGTNSIRAALESHTVPITGVNEVTVDSFRNFDIQEVGVIGYYGGEFKVSVMTG